MKIDKNYYPGWVRRSICFTIDDGNLTLDKKFIDIVAPYGIRGTFNLSSPDLKNHTADFYRELYRGYGISNHCKLHPYAMMPGKEYKISEEAFSQQTADKSKLYRVPGQENVYFYYAPAGWRKIAEDKAYARLVTECHKELEAVFGKGSITTFVWPYGEQENLTVQDYVMNRCGYKAVRKTGATEDKTGFAVPADRMRWSYNANHKNLLSVAEKYEAYIDDGELKFLSFGVHSHDFERDNCWDVLEKFAEKYGNRPEDYWYASVEEIFAYRDAVDSLRIEDNTIANPTSIDIYVKIDGKRLIVPSGATLELR